MKRRAQTRGRTMPAASQLLLGLLLSLGVSAGAIVLFALAIQLAELGENWITPVNQFIKVGSILAGTFWACKGPLRGYQYGPLLGLAYMALGVGLYCALDGKLLPLTVILGDLALGAASGFLSGLLASSLKTGRPMARRPPAHRRGRPPCARPAQKRFAAALFCAMMDGEVRRAEGGAVVMAPAKGVGSLRRARSDRKSPARPAPRCGSARGDGSRAAARRPDPCRPEGEPARRRAGRAPGA